MQRRGWLLVLTLTAGVVAIAAAGCRTEQDSAVTSHLRTQMQGRYSVENRLRQHAAEVEARLAPAFTAAGLGYPAKNLAYVAIKDRRRLQVYARDAEQAPWRFVRSYPVLGQSGDLGPKLREGDLQVPEGIYAAEDLNPNSRFHLSIRLNYPNAFDKATADAEGRTNLGSDIMIHGADSSIGCLAVGDVATEDLFILAALASKERVRIIVSPVDFRNPEVRMPPAAQPWIDNLYKSLKAELAEYPSDS
jgi:murein L,D-transpeptidase YafK